MAKKPKPQHEPEVEAKKLGRPVHWTPALRAEACKTIFTRMHGGEHLDIILSETGPSEKRSLPALSTFFDWLEEDADLAERYARARARLVDVYAIQTVSIADACVDPAKARIQFDARRWFASKIAPKVYGEKTVQDINVNDGRQSQQFIELAEKLKEIEVSKRLTIEYLPPEKK